MDRAAHAKVLLAVAGGARLADAARGARIEITLGTYAASLPEVLQEEADNLNRALGTTSIIGERALERVR